MSAGIVGAQFGHSFSANCARRKINRGAGFRVSGHSGHSSQHAYACACRRVYVRIGVRGHAGVRARRSL